MTLKRCCVKVGDVGVWITVHPNGEGSKGTPVRIDKDSGKILAGMGGKFNGKTLKESAESGWKASKNLRKKTSQKSERAIARAKRRKERSKSVSSSLSIDLRNPEKISSDLILQNRNRSTKGSIAQMRAISKAPDYKRLGVDNYFGSGAPVVAYGNIPENQKGKITEAVMPDGTRYTVQYAVIDANDVLASHDSSGSKVDEYFSSDPSKSRAIAGNGRIAGLKSAFEQGTADDYVDDMANDSSMHGISEDVIDEIENPILVRLMQPKDVTKDIGDKSNVQSGLKMTTVEQANNDKNRVDFSGMEFYEDGTPHIDAVKKFVRSMPENERGGLIDTNGNPTREAQSRLESAMFAKAYDNDSLTRLQSQALDPESKNIIGALVAAAPEMAKLEGLNDGYDVRDIVSNAVYRAIDAKRKGQKIDEIASNEDLFKSEKKSSAEAEIMKMISRNIRSRKNISEALTNLAKRLRQESESAEGGLFSDFLPKLSPEDLIKSSMSGGSGGGSSLFDSFSGKMSKDSYLAWSVFGGIRLKRFFSSINL